MYYVLQIISTALTKEHKTRSKACNGNIKLYTLCRSPKRACARALKNQWESVGYVFTSHILEIHTDFSRLAHALFRDFHKVYKFLPPLARGNIHSSHDRIFLIGSAERKGGLNQA